MPSNLHAPHANPQSMYTETDRQKHRVSSVSSQATSSCHPPMYMHAHDIAPSPSRYMGPSMSGSAAVTRGLQPEAILAEFYTRKSKKPTLQQQYELCSATGMSSEAVANWFLTTRAADASWSSAQPTRGPHDLQRPRTRFTHEQKAILEMYYLRNPKPGVTDRSRIAVEVGVDLVAVNNWYDHIHCSKTDVEVLSIDYCRMQFARPGLQHIYVGGRPP
ncbi:hypothetical protein C8T65DRAFT_696737 [Cerioporus squamosus]|nr:hypothetical protein C8T65DRAFT_696737 [Cerioporus squamosus]